MMNIIGTPGQSNRGFLVNFIKEQQRKNWLKNNKELLIFTHGEDWWRKQIGEVQYMFHKRFNI